MRTLHRKLSPFCLASALIGVIQSAAAQETPPPAATPVAEQKPADAASVSMLPEVVVTANKREESQRLVPAAVSVLTGKQLEDVHATSFEDVVSRIPAMNFSSEGPGSVSVSLRGVSAGSEASATVGFLIDEVPMGSSTQMVLATTFPDPSLFDVKSVEVLAGPQGTLYGANTLGGLMKYAYLQPSLAGEEFRIQLEPSVKTPGSVGAAGRVAFNYAMPGIRTAIRASAAYSADSGFINDPNRGEEHLDKGIREMFRIASLSQLTDDLSIELDATRNVIRRDGLSTVTYDAGTEEPYQGRRDQYTFMDQPTHILSNLEVAKINWRFDWGLLTSITGHQNVSTLYTVDSTWTVGSSLNTGDLIRWRTDAPASLGKLTEELRFSTDIKDAFHILVGAFYGKEDAQQTGNVCDDGNRPQCGIGTGTVNELLGALGLGEIVPPSSLIDIPLVEASLNDRFQDLAVFSNVTWTITDKLDLTLGLREGENRAHYFGQETGILSLANSGALSSTTDTKYKSYVTNFLVNPRFKLSRDAMVYARVANSYRPGGPNFSNLFSTTANGATFAPDSLISYEVGAKAAFLDRRIDLDVAAYHIDWKNIQLSVNGTGLESFANAPGAVVDGAECASQFHIARGWTGNAGLSYDVSRLSDDAPEVGAVAGDRLPGVSKWMGTLGSQYSFSLPADMRGSLGANYRYVGARKDGWTGSTSQPAWPMDPYSLVDLNAGLRHDSLKVDLYVKNLLNTVAETTANLVPAHRDAGVLGQVGVIQPRTIGMTVSAEW